MTTDTELLAACLQARFVTLSWSMARLLTLVRPASEGSSAHLATTDFVEPTWLVFENALAAQARLCCKVSTFWAILVISVATMI